MENFAKRGKGVTKFKKSARGKSFFSRILESKRIKK